MSTLEDRILGEKTVNYCSSSSSSDNNDSDNTDNEECDNDRESALAASLSSRSLRSHAAKWTGTSVNTGPKGVLNDFRELEHEEGECRSLLDRARIDMIKKCSITCKSTLDDEVDRLRESEDDPELIGLYDEHLLDHQRRRLREMIIGESYGKKKFGTLDELKNGDEFLKVLDEYATDGTLLVIHLFKKKVRCCDLLNERLNDIAKEYEWIRFCKLDAENAMLSDHFKTAGIPAILVYRSGQLIGNFVRVSDELGLYFDTDTVREFLIEENILPDIRMLSSIIQNNMCSNSPFTR